MSLYTSYTYFFFIFLMNIGFFHIFLFCFCYYVLCFFFFKQKTAYEMRMSDWSSDVCSSDLGSTGPKGIEGEIAYFASFDALVAAADSAVKGKIVFIDNQMEPTQDGSGYGLYGRSRFMGPSVAAKKRSEERRGGKKCVSTCRSRWSPDH